VKLIKLAGALFTNGRINILT